MEECRNTAIVLAAGQGKRMHSKIQKQFLEIGGKPILYYSMECFQKSPLIQDIILVTGEDMISYCQSEIVEKYGFTKVCKVTAGGKERYDSVDAGLLCCQDTDYVYIHDGARPLISRTLINANINCVQETKACITAVPAKDTIKVADDNDYVADTPDRSRLWQIQTPQSFSYALVLEAYRKREEAMDGTMTDDAMVVEKYTSHPIRLLKGDYRNIKITTPEDLVVAEAFLKENRE